MRLQLVVIVTAIMSAPGAARADGLWRIAMDTLVYVDSDNVSVLSPQVAVRRQLDEDGGAVSARAVVDAISAASVDVVSQATTRFEEVRTEGDVSVAKRVGGYLAAVGYRVSQEPDYVSHGVRGSAQRRIRGADTTASAGYGITFDTIGMSGTAASVFSESLTTHSADLGLTQVLGRKTLARLVYTLTVQRGYMEKPYRFVPLFDEAGMMAAAAAGVTLDLDNFHDYRLPTKPSEQVPESRVRQAIAFRGLRYVSGLGAALRLDYRFYFDSWGVTGHTLEPAVRKHVGAGLQVDAYARLYTQSGARFWRRAYVVPAMSVPKWRTVDRALSPFRSASGNLRVAWRRGGFDSYVEFTGMYTEFLAYMFLDSRFALVGQLGVRWTP